MARLKLGKEGIVLLALSLILVAGITVGMIRHIRAGEMKLEASVKGNMVIELNSATADELEKLPGIGPQLASRIVEYRTKNGPFVTADSLVNVDGIGEIKLAEMKPYLEVVRCPE